MVIKTGAYAGGFLGVEGLIFLQKPYEFLRTPLNQNLLILEKFIATRPARKGGGRGVQILPEEIKLYKMGVCFFFIFKYFKSPKNIAAGK